MKNKRQADSLSHENSSNTIVLESEEADNDREDPSQSQDSREPSRLQKDKFFSENAGAEQGLSGNERGDEGLVRKSPNPHDDQFNRSKPDGSDSELSGDTRDTGRHLRGNLMTTRNAVYTVNDVDRLFGKKWAQNMKKKGLKFVDKDVFDSAWVESLNKRQAEHNYDLSKDYAKDHKGEPLVNYYDNWDVEWCLYNASDFNKKGSHIGEYKSADKARQAASAEGEGNYVIEGECLRPEKGYWGYYVVSVNNKGRITRYAKKPVYVHETHAGYRTASNNLIEISLEEFMADSITAGRIVRAKLSKRNAAAVKGFVKAAQKMLDNVGVTNKTFPQADDRRSLREVLSSADKCMENLHSLVASMSDEDKAKLEGAVETLEEVCHTDLDGDMESGEGVGHQEEMGGMDMGEKFSGDAMKAYAALAKLTLKERKHIASLV